ncbi:MAG: hydantoinase B/oxoprolinase family protein [Candidatus Tectomicrobia bacterium]|nr:hydantoinase B/oxoprolinase family protein [Candidatus Tectomicrobia bacterium]
MTRAFSQPGSAPADRGFSGADLRTSVDPITTEVVRNAVVAITDEMKTNLMRTAYNPIIYDALDFTVGLFDAQGNTISIGLGLPMFIRGLSDTVRAKLAHFQRPGGEGIKPGDILLTNDAYIVGSHLNHMVFSLPIFFDGELVAFAASMAHWQDIGGTLSGTTTDIYSEGLQLPIVKIYKEGRLDTELTDIIRANVRFPDLAMGDFRAQIAAVRTGEKRILGLLARYGKTEVFEVLRAIMDFSEQQARRAVAAIPDGVYEAESFMDDDGVVVGKRIPLKVKVEVEGERMRIDFTEVSRQVSGYFNSGSTAGRSAAEVAFKCVTSPLLLPINEGSFRPLELILPPGRVVSALKPAAMRWWMTIPMTLVDTVIRALAPALPRHVAAGHHADLLVSTLYGVNPRSGRFFLGTTAPPGGGWGAKHNEDGMCVTVCINDGDTHNASVESTEARLPIIVEEYGLRPDSGGAGRQRGGLGMVRSVRVLGEARVNTHIERTQCAPWGLYGGRDGLSNEVYIRRADGRIERPPNGKLSSEILKAGDAYVVVGGGGGGYGDPRQRDPARLLDDVRNGYVSRDSAVRDYGIDPGSAGLEEPEAEGGAANGGGAQDR